MTHKLIALNAHHVGIIGSESDASRRTWLVLGVGYTENDEIAYWADNRGYQVEQVDEIPESHRKAVANLEAYSFNQKNMGAADGADPEAIYHFTGNDGHTRVDVRDVIAGRPAKVHFSN
jgi:hypothetical protein